MRSQDLGLGLGKESFIEKRVLYLLKGNGKSHKSKFVVELKGYDW